MGIVSGKRNRKTVGSFPSVGVLFSVILSLLVLGLFGLLMIYSAELERMVHRKIRMQVFLSNSLSEAQIVQLKHNMTGRYFTNRDGGDEEAVSYVSQEAAAQMFIKETGEDFKAFLGDNPLHPELLVQIKPEYQTPEGMRKVKQEIEQTAGVMEAVYTPDLIDSIHENIARINLGLIAAMCVLLAVVVLLINQAIRLALFSQRFLIRGMQLVGATQWFVRKAFLWRALLLGVTSGIIACLLLAGLLSAAMRKIPELSSIQNNERLGLLAIALICGGVAISAASSLLAVRRYQNLTLDKLY